MRVELKLTESDVSSVSDSLRSKSTSGIIFSNIFSNISNGVCMMKMKHCHGYALLKIFSVTLDKTFAF